MRAAPPPQWGLIYARAFIRIGGAIVAGEENEEREQKVSLQSLGILVRVEHSEFVVIND